MAQAGTYHQGGIQYAHMRPLPQSLEATFDATPAELNLKPLVLRVGGSHVGIALGFRPT